ncbi:MAG TPA: DUF1508 domain-containing protein [Planctomycetaceae bacterium]|jgi:uncharacterized protein YegP (UPF0339 family)|nr:DUF1508 domain-containing protein [Planctomycetaceae bacterium]
MMFYMYRDEDGHWRWRLATASGQTLAESPAAYPRKEDCRAVIQLVMNCRIARVHEILTPAANAFANVPVPGP